MMPPRIIRIPGIMSGEPCVEGTRILAATLLAEAGLWHSGQKLTESYPTLPPGIAEGLEYYDFVCGVAADRRGAKPEQIISYTYGEVDVHLGHASFVVLYEEADGTEGILAVPGTAREWRTLDKESEHIRLMQVGALLFDDWLEQKRLATMGLPELHHTLLWESWLESRPPYRAPPGFDLWWQMGALAPTEMRIKSGIAGWIAFAMEKQDLDDNAAAEKAGMYPHEIKQIREGMVGYFSVYDLMWTASRLGMHVMIDAVDMEEGDIWI